MIADLLEKVHGGTFRGSAVRSGEEEAGVKKMTAKEPPDFARGMLRSAQCDGEDEEEKTKKRN